MCYKMQFFEFFFYYFYENKVICNEFIGTKNFTLVLIQNNFMSKEKIPRIYTHMV